MAALNDSHALRYYESLNIAAVRIKAPSQELSYGIEWDLPGAPPRTGVEDLDKVVRQMAVDRAAVSRVSIGSWRIAGRDCFPAGTARSRAA